MKIQQVIEKVNSLKSNRFDDKDKIGWLSTLDATVKTQIIDTHEGGEKLLFTGYDEKTDTQTELLVPAPYDEMYLHYLAAQMEYYDAQEDRYNNAMDLFNSVWDRFRKHYHRNHMPLGCTMKYY